MQQAAIRDAIETFLVDELGVEPADVAADESLFTNRVLSSMDIVSLVSFLEERFALTISPLDVSFELFDRPSFIAEYVNANRGKL